MSIINIYLIFSNYNIFINIKDFKKINKKSLGSYGYKGKKKKNYYYIISVLNKLLNNINFIDKNNININLYLKGYSNYKNNLIKYIYKFFTNKNYKKLEFNLIDLTKISFI